jgi:signal transduction histidine kinase
MNSTTDGEPVAAHISGTTHADVTLLIADVVARTGVTQQRLRSWERAGLLHPRRLPNAVRVYSVEDVARVRLIARSLVRPGRRGSLRRRAASLARGEVRPDPHDYQDLESRPSGERAWRSLIDAIPEFLVACDLEGRLIALNPALRAVLANDGHTVPGAALPAVLEPLPLRWTARTGTVHHDVALTLPGPENRALLTLWSVTPLRLDSGALYGAMGMGRAAPAQAAFPDDWLTSAAHDLRGPATAILGWAQLARRVSLQLYAAKHADEDQRMDVEKLDRYVARAEVSTLDMIRMMDTLLDAAAAASGSLLHNLDPSDVAIDALALEAVTHAGAHTSRHTISLEAPAAPMLVRGDRVRLRQLLDNLLDNAVKYAPDGGPITVRLDTDNALGWVTARVTDSGLGIPTAAVPYVFDRFWRASGLTRQLPGSGLGLYVCRAIAIAHGGHIEIERSVPVGEEESQTPPWHGTVIRLLLPLAMPRDIHGAVRSTGT